MSWHGILSREDVYEVNGHCFHLFCKSVTLNQPTVWKYECCRCTDTCIVPSLLKNAQETISSMSPCTDDRTEPPQDWEDEDFIYHVGWNHVDQCWRIEGLRRHLVGMSIEDVDDDDGLTITFAGSGTLMINNDGVYFNGIEFIV